MNRKLQALAEDPRPLVLVNGGLSSTTLLHWVARERAARVLFVDCGQYSASAEHAAADHYARHLHCELLQLDVSRVGNQLREQQVEATQAPIPHHHLVLMSLALSYAQQLGASELVIGITAEGALGSCAPSEFVTALGGVAAALGQVAISAPFIEMTKADVIERGLQLGIDFSKTHDCLNRNDGHCGHCSGCVGRERAFEIAQRRRALRSDTGFRRAASEHLRQAINHEDDAAPIFASTLEQALSTQQSALRCLATVWTSHPATLPWLVYLAENGPPELASRALLWIATNWKLERETVPWLLELAGVRNDIGVDRELTYVFRSPNVAKYLPQRVGPDELLLLERLATTSADPTVRVWALRFLTLLFAHAPATHRVLRTCCVSPNPALRQVALDALTTPGYPGEVSWLKTLVVQERETIAVDVLKHVLRAGDTDPELLPSMVSPVLHKATRGAREAMLEHLLRTPRTLFEEWLVRSNNVNWPTPTPFSGNWPASCSRAARRRAMPTWDSLTWAKVYPPTTVSFSAGWCTRANSFRRGKSSSKSVYGRRPSPSARRAVGE